jgi:hypothetical protein
LLLAAALACTPGLKRERHRLQTLRNLVEQAAAPEEPVLVDDWLVFRFLRWKGSPALRQQMVFTRRAIPAAASAAQEVVVISGDGGPLPAALRATGFVLTEDEMQGPWIEAGEGVQLPGQGTVRIYFAVRCPGPPISSQPRG